MTEPIVVTDAALDELEASRTFEAFYQAEARTLFRRLWLVTGSRAEADEVMQDPDGSNAVKIADGRPDDLALCSPSPYPLVERRHLGERGPSAVTSCPLNDWTLGRFIPSPRPAATPSGESRR